MNGGVICYLGLAYNLYLIKHNVELQDRLVARLKDHQQFQGAYYELLVANILIRAGFELELEDEDDRSTKHCEFSARSIESGDKFWVEAKMRSVNGLMGKSPTDSAKGNDVTSQLSKHVGEALAKPAPDRRMIFIDVNGEPQTDHKEPEWASKAARRLEGKEQNLKNGDEAYVFVTNFAYHRALDDAKIGCAALAFGLGVPGFGDVGEIRLMDWYKNKQKHSDAFKIIESLRKYPQIPETFDGKPSSEAYDESATGRLLKGETYFFDDVGDNGTLGTVQSVAVDEKAKIAIVAIGTLSGSSMLLRSPMSDGELSDYKKYGGAFFGEKNTSGKKVDDIFEFYEWLVGNYLETPKERLLELAKDHSEIERFKAMEQLDIVLELCEGWAVATRLAGKP